MSLNYSPWWKSLYMQRHGVPSTCNIPFSPDFNISNYGHTQFPLPLIDTTESFIDEMNKLSEITSTPEKKSENKTVKINSHLYEEETGNNGSSSNEDNIDVETTDKARNDQSVMTTDKARDDQNVMDINSTDNHNVTDQNQVSFKVLRFRNSILNKHLVISKGPTDFCINFQNVTIHY